MQSGFTIVELLVVIVVIGILAAITIVSYSGIAQKATVASLTSDLSKASTQLKIFQTVNGNYPETVSIDCVANPDTVTNKCLKLSAGNVIISLAGDYSVNNTTNPQTFRLTIKNSSTDTLSVITNNSKPVVLLTAPLNPVADWIATPTGDHYGNFYDTVTKQYATVTRSTPKTIYDPATQHIYDVPADKLAINTRSDGKNGYEAVVEEARTNYSLGSSFETDVDKNGIADNWTRTGSGLNYSLDNNKSVVGIGSQKISKSNPTTDIISQSVGAPIAAGDSFTYSVWVKGEGVSGLKSGSDFGLYIDASGGADPAEYGTSTAAPVGMFDWTRIAMTKTFTYNHPTHSVYPIFRNKTGTVWFDGLQVEKGAFATSYIPTNTAVASRSADLIKVPTVSDFNSGSVFAVMGQPPSISRGMGVYTFGYSGSNSILFYAYGNIITAGFNTGGIYTYGQSKGSLNTYNTGIWRWGPSGSQQSLNNSNGSILSVMFPSGTPTNTYLGSYYGGSYNYGAPIQRITVYPSFLSDGDVSTIAGSIKDGQ